MSNKTQDLNENQNELNPSISTIPLTKAANISRQHDTNNDFSNEVSSAVRFDTVSETGYCDSNVAMFIPSLNRASPEPTLRSLPYAPTIVSNITPNAVSIISHQTNPNSEIALNSINNNLNRNDNINTDNNTAISVDNISVHASNVRHNWINHLSRSYHNISRTSKYLLIFSVVTSLIQIIASIIVLIVAWGQTCDSHLEIFILLYLIRLIISVPITILYYLKPGRRNSTSSLRPWIERCRSIVDVFSMLLFVVGNYLLFTSNDCNKYSPTLYYFSLTLVIFGYIIITIPVFFCGAVIFCLPCVLAVMRFLHIGEITGVGASAELINKVPVFKFDKELSLSNRRITETSTINGTSNNILNSPDTVDTVINSSSASIKSTKRSLFRSLFVSKSKGKAHFKKMTKKSKQLPIIKMEDEADAVCAICLAEYEDQEELRYMFCNHHYHVECVDEWLKQNRTCPLCKRDITGSNEVPEDED